MDWLIGVENKTVRLGIDDQFKIFLFYEEFLAFALEVDSLTVDWDHRKCATTSTCTLLPVDHRMLTEQVADIVRTDTERVMGYFIDDFGVLTETMVMGILTRRYD